MRVAFLAAVCAVAVAASLARAEDEFDGAPEHHLAAGGVADAESSRQSGGGLATGQQHVLSFLICQS
jgi:hypothetical protein